MPWVAKNPKPDDFCGCPPCPLCYVYVEDDGMTIKGMEKFIKDMLGGKFPSSEDRSELELAALKIHEKNKLKSHVDDVEMFKQADETQRLVRFFECNLKEAKLKLRRPPKRHQPVLDHIDLDARAAAADQAVDAEKQAQKDAKQMAKEFVNQYRAASAKKATKEQS